MYIMGASLNGFARKQSFVIEAGEDIRNSMLGEFYNRWDNGNPV